MTQTLTPPAFDRHGNAVGLGDIIRVLEMCEEFLDILPDDERPHVLSMLNREFPIDEITADGKASVSIWWEIAEDITGHSGLYLLPDEFELVRAAQVK